MELNVINESGQACDKISVSDAIFAREYNEPLVHHLVVAYQANARLGTRAQLNRRDVHHSTKKPWRQKGTGRARPGMSSSPVWRGGGRAFPNSPRENFTQKVNKKAYRAAMCSIYSKLVADGRLSVIDALSVDSPKTKEFYGKIKALGLADSALIITDNLDERLFLASRNVKNVMVTEPRYADPLSLIFYHKVLITKDAVAKIEEMLG